MTHSELHFRNAAEFPQIIPLVQKTGPLRRRVALGMTVYNGARFVQETIDSIVAQDFTDFALVILDDCSQDDSAEIIAEAARRHDNVFAFRHVARRAMITTWADVYHLSRVIVPNHEFFAWCSDHDVLKPAWLAALVRTLQDHPEAAHAYPLSAHIDEFGMPATEKKPTPLEFSTAGCHDPLQRFRMLNDAAQGAGNIVYGLVRSEFLPRIGVFRRLLLPDRMYFLELGLLGELHQVREVLRLRRETTPFSIERQTRTLFESGRVPLSAHLSWPITHAGAFFWNYRSRRMRPAGVGIFALAILSFQIIFRQFRIQVQERHRLVEKAKLMRRGLAEKAKLTKVMEQRLREKRAQKESKGEEIKRQLRAEKRRKLKIKRKQRVLAFLSKYGRR